MARKLVRRWPAAAEELARVFWPGPLTLIVPARIAQAADDQRVKANPPAPLKGIDQLVTELRDINSNTGQPLIYQRYPEGEFQPYDYLGVHFATINHDLPQLVTWLKPLLQGAN